MTVAKVQFQNPGPFAQADLESVAGVHPGQKLGMAQVQAAAQHLADTGCFDDVHVDSKGSASALTLIFLLKPSMAGDVHPVEFTNFVWLTPAELEQAVHVSAPLFGTSGKLPETTAVLDAVSAGLVEALAKKGIAGADVGHELRLATSSRPVSVVQFTVNRPAVVVGKVNLTGVSPELEAVMRAREKKLEGGRLTMGEGPGSTAYHLVQPYLDRGFLDARLAAMTLHPGQEEGRVIPVEVSASVESGSAYHVQDLTFEATPVVSSVDFASHAKLHAGDVASRSSLLASEEPVDVAYHKLGYMDTYVDTTATRNEAEHTVSYKLKVVPGNVYRMKSTNVQGLPPEAKGQFDQAWKLTPGEPYNADYVKAFLNNNSAIRSLANYAGTFEAAADPSTHMVELTILFHPAVRQGQ